MTDGNLLAAIEKLAATLERHGERLDKVMSLRVKIHELGYMDNGKWVPYPSRREQFERFVQEPPPMLASVESEDIY